MYSCSLQILLRIRLSLHSRQFLFQRGFKNTHNFFQLQRLLCFDSTLGIQHAVGFSPTTVLQRTAEITKEQVDMLTTYISTTLTGEQGVCWQIMEFDHHIQYYSILLLLLVSSIFCWSNFNRFNETNKFDKVFFIGLTISGILPEVPVDPMKVVQDAVLEFTDKKDLFLAYMSSMLVGGPGEEKKYKHSTSPAQLT